MKSRTRLARVSVLLGALALVGASCSSSGEPLAVELTPDQLFTLQTACFDAGLFFDANGTCYSDAALTQRAATPAPGASASSSSSSTVPPAPGDTKPPPVAPTTQAPGGTAPPATSAPTTKAPTTTTTQAPQPPPTIGNSEWILRLVTNAPGGMDNPIALAFAVNNGDVSGSNYDPFLEKTCTTDGTIDGSGDAVLFTDCQNKGVFDFFGVLDGTDFIEGDYVWQNGGLSSEGIFTMTRN